MRYFLSLTGSSGFGGLDAADDRRDSALPIELPEKRPILAFVTPWARLESAAQLMLCLSAGALSVSGAARSAAAGAKQQDGCCNLRSFT